MDLDGGFDIDKVVIGFVYKWVKLKYLNLFFYDEVVVYLSICILRIC